MSQAVKTLLLTAVVPPTRRPMLCFVPRQHGSYPSAVHVGFVVDIVILGQAFSEYFGFPLSAIIS
jgi:hypothetical protein